MSPDGARIAAVERDKGIVAITETKTGAEIASWRVGRAGTPKKALAYSPDGRRLAGTGEAANMVDIWDAQTHQRTARMEGHAGAVYSVAFSPDRKTLALTPRRCRCLPTGELTNFTASTPKRAANLPQPVWGSEVKSRTAAECQW